MQPMLTDTTSHRRDEKHGGEDGALLFRAAQAELRKLRRRQRLATNHPRVSERRVHTPNTHACMGSTHGVARARARWAARWVARPLAAAALVHERWSVAHSAAAWGSSRAQRWPPGRRASRVRKEQRLGPERKQALVEVFSDERGQQRGTAGGLGQRRGGMRRKVLGAHVQHALPEVALVQLQRLLLVQPLREFAALGWPLGWEGGTHATT
jgi:hypothetical protein